MALYPAKSNIQNPVFNEAGAQKLIDGMNPYSNYAAQIGTIPFFQTGARAFIKLGGRPLTVVQDIKWKVSYAATPIQTVDSLFPWDIDIGAATIHAFLTSVMDPTKGPEADGLFTVMKAAEHQPLIELQVLDYLGTSLFFARGMFTEVGGSVARGAVSSWNAQFIGVAYQHYVSQSFKPYNTVAGAATKALDSLKNLASDVSGGLL